MRARELRYGDVLRSTAYHKHVVMYLGETPTLAATPPFAANYINLLIVAGANAMTLSRAKDGEIIRVSPEVLGHYELLESGPELPETA